MPSRSSSCRLGAWALVALVLATWLVAGLIGGRVELTPADADGSAPSADPLVATGEAPVVVVGVPGLTWDLIDEQTPTLERLADEGGAGALVLRGTHEVTCAPDAWLTLGAGQRASTDVAGCGDAEGAGTAYPIEAVVHPDGAGAQIDADRWAAWQDAAARRALSPQLGTLGLLEGGAAGCVAAYGPGAALAAATPDGKVAHYRPEGLDGGPIALDGECRLHLVAAPEVLEGDRNDALAGIDATLADLVADLPEGARLIVAGMGHTAGRADAQAVVAGPVGGMSNPRGTGGELASLSTQQSGLVQLTDLTTGIIQALGTEADVPADRLAGGQLRVVAGDADSAADLARGVSLAKTLMPWTIGALGLLLVVPLLLAVALRRARAVAVLATLVMAALPATFLAGLVPWWSAGQPWPALTLAILVAAGLLTVAAWAGPWRRHPLGPPAVVAALTLAVLGADVLTSSRLGLVSVLGLQPVTAGRFYGQGNVGFGIVLGALLVLAAGLLTWLSTRLRRVEAAAAVAILGGVTLLLNAAPSAGADFGGVPALVLVTGLLVLSALQVRWTGRSIIGLGLAAVVVAAAVMVADWARGPGNRTHLGDFVQSVLDGEALGIIARKLQQSLGILVSYPLSWAAVLALALVAWVVLARPAWSAALWRSAGFHPAALAGVVGMAVTWALNDSGIAAVAMTLTMLIGTSLALIGRPSAREIETPEA